MNKKLTIILSLGVAIFISVPIQGLCAQPLPDQGAKDKLLNNYATAGDRFGEVNKVAADSAGKEWPVHCRFGSGRQTMRRF